MVSIKKRILHPIYKFLTKRYKQVILTTGFMIISAILFVYLSDIIVESKSKGKVYSDVTDIPYNKTGLLLGTSRLIKGGYFNQYYINRIEAALELYKAGKIKYIIVSGDNSRKDYDEPTDMKQDLINGGIPAKRIYLDYAGFRTLDSVVRCKEIFGQDSITVISQSFHNKRAIYIADTKGINAIGYNADEVISVRDKIIKFREKLARTKMVLDLITDKEPKFLGEKVIIE